MEDASVLFGLVLVFALTIYFYWLPVIMADNRQRSKLGWFLVGLFASPLLAIIILWIIGHREEVNRT